MEENKYYDWQNCIYFEHLDSEFYYPSESDKSAKAEVREVVTMEPVPAKCVEPKVKPSASGRLLLSQPKRSALLSGCKKTKILGYNPCL